MKEVQLISLSAQNFKGIKEANYTFDGKSAIISGRNGTGKSSIYQAYTWCLFDTVCDNFGTPVKSPDVKPMGEGGEPIHNLETKVEVKLSITDSGTSNTITLSRTMAERWVKKRGGAKAFSGNSNVYALNSVPCFSEEFAGMVNSIFPANLWWLLSSVSAFANLHWTKRREILSQICTIPADRELMELSPDFADLAKETIEIGLEGLVKKLKVDVKKLTAEQKAIPARLSEVQAQIEPLKSIDFDSLKSNATVVASELADALTQLADAKNALDSTSGLPNMIATREAQLSGIQKQIKTLKEEFAEWNESLNKLRDEYKAESRPVNVSQVCPTCGQQLLPHQIDKAVRSAKTAQENRLSEIKSKANTVKRFMQSIQEQIAAAEATAHEIKIDIERAESKLTSRPLFNPEIAALESKIASLTSKKAGIDSELAKESLLQALWEREQELLDTQADTMRSLDNAERLLDTVNRYATFKAERTEQAVNSLFQKLQVKMFTKQVNGELADTCDLYVGGVRYGHGLNTGAMYNAGLEIISVLSHAWGVSVPLFVDGAESITNFAAPNTQVIKLCVADGDLRLDLNSKN